MIAYPYLDDTNPVCMQHVNQANKKKVEWHRTSCHVQLLSPLDYCN